MGWILKEPSPYGRLLRLTLPLVPSSHTRQHVDTIFYTNEPLQLLFPLPSSFNIAVVSYTKPTYWRISHPCSSQKNLQHSYKISRHKEH